MTRRPGARGLLPHVKASLTTIVVLATFALATSACGSSAGGGSSAALDGTSWRLTGWTLSSLAATDFTITAEFADGRVGGKSAVNSYGGPYTTGSDGAVSVGELAATEMAGPEPAMRAEGAYLVLLRQAASYRLAGDRLTFFDEGGNESLIFTAATP